MIELRWLQPKKGFPWPTPRLQYRELGLSTNTQHQLIPTEWSDWQDVPTVDEEGQEVLDVLMNQMLDAQALSSSPGFFTNTPIMDDDDSTLSGPDRFVCESDDEINIHLSNKQDPDSWDTDMKTIKFPFNIEKLVRWCHRRGWLKWVAV